MTNKKGISFMNLGTIVAANMKDPTNLYMIDVLSGKSHW